LDKFKKVKRERGEAMSTRRRFNGEPIKNFNRRSFYGAKKISSPLPVRQNDTNVSLITPQNIEVSIIMPSYNRYPLNLFSLYSLENQTFDPSKMEVIFIDDASTDETQNELRNYRPVYHFKYMRSEQNLGRAKVRNLGIKSARGRILIFLDAEMICEPDFVENHYQYHQTSQNAIITGVMHMKRIISCSFPETSNDRLTSQAKRGSKKSTTLLEKNKPFLLLTKADITNQTYKDSAVKTDSWFNTITQNFDEELKGFQFPWMAFLTGNVSITKDLIEQAGMFDEEFVKFGYEDWELGYRLYKMGAQFFIKDNLVTYHQEHPIGESKWKEAMENFYLFISKHRDVDVLILGLEIARFTDLLSLNKIVKEYKQLMKNEEFNYFQEKFISILEAIALLLRIDVRHFNVLGAMGYGSSQKSELEKDINLIKKQKDYPNLSKLLSKILNS
jgi:glycosyltransferase involved in cell wall biosynthesis